MTMPEPRPPLQMHEMVHPRTCDTPWCLVEPVIQRDGRVSHWGGYHRGDVEVISTAHGTVVEVALARVDDSPGRFGEPSIHLHSREGQGGRGQFESVLTPSEARRMAADLVNLADWIEQHAEDIYEEGEIADRLIAELRAGE